MDEQSFVAVLSFLHLRRKQDRRRFLLVAIAIVLHEEKVRSLLNMADDDERDSATDSDLEDEDGVTFISGSPTPEPERVNVMEAVATASAQRVRDVLTIVCATIPQAHERASQELLSNHPSGGQGKRKLFETCKHCNKEYSVESNAKGDCLSSR